MRKAWICLVLLLPGLATAQFDFGGGQPSMGQSSDRPWESFKLPAKNLKLDFRNSGVTAIITFFQKESGITIVPDPALTGTMNVTTATAVPMKEAFQVLATTLRLKGFDMRKEGNLLVIQRRDQRNNNNNNRPQQPDWTQFLNQGGDREEPVLKTYQIKNANASQVARVLNEVFAPAGAVPGRGNFNFGRGGNNNNIQRMMQMMQGQGSQGQVRASSDDYSNTVIVNAPEREQRQVQTLINEIDKPSEDPQTTEVYTLEFATASEIAPVVQNVLVSNAPRGRGGIGTQNIDPGQRFQQAMRFGSAQAAFGQVVADPRTNALIVTATPENQEVIGRVIDQLDTEIVYENTTFVFPLSNARADDVAQLIGQAFGQRQGTNNRGGNFTGGNFGGMQRNNNQRNNNQRNNNNRGGFGGNNNLTEEELLLEVDENGELQTNVAIAQGFQFGGAAARPGQQGGPARDQNGRVVNVRELQGQITAIPDLNTNSIIVVATPENADVIRQILDQLDRIPEQVMIETIIVEATLDSSSKLGVEWNLVQNNVFNAPGNTGSAGTDFGLATATQPQDREGFKYTLSGGALTGMLQLLQSDQRFSVLSTPRIFTSNNVEAEINISQQVPYVVSSRQDANGAFTYNYTFTDVGIILNVRPRITANGFVAMDVSQTANELQGFTSFNAPIINQRQAETTVSVRDGETIVLGGIMRSTVNTTVKKLPILGDIPILGNLFKSTSKQNVKTELLVFLTPRVVRNPDEARKLREESEQGMSPDTKKALEKVIKPAGTNGGGDPTQNSTGGKTNGGN